MSLLYVSVSADLHPFSLIYQDNGPEEEVCFAFHQACFCCWDWILLCEEEEPQADPDKARVPEVRPAGESPCSVYRGKDEVTQEKGP